MSNVYFSLFYPISYPEDFYVDMPIKVCLLPQLMVKPGNLLSILNPTTLSYIILHYPTPSYTILHHPTSSTMACSLTGESLKPRSIRTVTNNLYILAFT